MINFEKRNFLKKFINYGAAFSLVAISADLIFGKSKMKFISEKFYLMGTNGRIQIFVDDFTYGKLVIKEALNKLKFLELMFTKFSPYSDIGKINCNPFVYTTVSKDVLFVLKLGSKLSVLTKGYFDMGVGNLLSHVGIDGFVPMVGNCTTNIDMKTQLIDISNNRIKLRRKNAMLDLGGIGKGYAIDVVVEFLIKMGVKHIILEFGGDIRAYGGTPDEKPWKVKIDDRLSFLFNNSNFIDLFTGSIAISGGYLKKSLMNNTFIKHHIVDPIFLVSRDYYFAIMVSGKMASVCDALSTSYFNMKINILREVVKNFSEYKVEIYV